MTSPFHHGEIRIQERTGTRATARRTEGGIHRTMPVQAQLFLEQRRLVVLGTTDRDDRPWASVLTGEPGFAHVPDPATIRIVAVPVSGDPLSGNLAAGRFAGMTAADLSRRMRLRVNGRLDRDRDGAILIRTDQVYSNCPKYIQAREYDRIAEVEPAVPIRRGSLTETQREWIRSADTFFIATANPGEGADASHRGGMPGFIRAEGNRLTWPDYRGNSMFCTLGNIEVHPRAGLVFPDFCTGATLQVTGRASIDWDARSSAGVPGAERLVVLEVEEVVEIVGAFRLRLRLLEYSRFNPEP